MQSYISNLEASFPFIYSQSKVSSSTNNSSANASSTSSATVSPPNAALSVNLTDEILPNRLPLKRRLVEFRFGRDGGTVTLPSIITTKKGAAHSSTDKQATNNSGASGNGKNLLFSSRFHYFCCSYFY